MKWYMEEGERQKEDMYLFKKKKIKKTTPQTLSLRWNYVKEYEEFSLENY